MTTSHNHLAGGPGPWWKQNTGKVMKMILSLFKPRAITRFCMRNHIGQLDKLNTFFWFGFISILHIIDTSFLIWKVYTFFYVLPQVDHRNCSRDRDVTRDMWSRILGTLRFNDADDNENVKKTIGLISKTTTLHVHRPFLYISFPFCKTTTWKCLISRFMEDVNKQRRNFISLSELEYGPLKFSFGRFRLQFTT